MKKLSERWKLSARTASQVAQEFERKLLDFQNDRRVMWGNRKLTRDAMFSAAVMHFLELPSHEQEAILEKNVAVLQGLLEGTATWPGAAGGGSEGGKLGVESVSGGTVVPKGPRPPARKRG